MPFTLRQENMQIFLQIQNRISVPKSVDGNIHGSDRIQQLTHRQQKYLNMWENWPTVNCVWPLSFQNANDLLQTSEQNDNSIGAAVDDTTLKLYKLNLMNRWRTMGLAGQIKWMT